MSGYTEDLDTYRRMCAYYKVEVQYVDGCKEREDLYGHGMELWKRFQKERVGKLWRTMKEDETFDDGHED